MVPNSSYHSGQSRLIIGELQALDGLRGVASIIVLIYHALSAYGTGIYYGYGVNDRNMGWYQLPVIRLLYDGGTMVYIFHIISGFLLSIKPLRLIRREFPPALSRKHYYQRNCKDDADRDFVTATTEVAAYRALSSSIIRRPLRLFLPAMVSTFITMVFHWLGCFEEIALRSLDPSTGQRPTRFELPAPRFESPFNQLRHWSGVTMKMMNPLQLPDELADEAVKEGRYYNPYNHHLWTLPMALRASYVVGLALFVLARVKMSSVRVVIVLAVAWLFAAQGMWEVTSALIGLILAESQVPSSGTYNYITQKRGNTLPQPHRRAAFSLFAVGLYLASYPRSEGPDTPGFRTISIFITQFSLNPASFCKVLGSYLITWAALNSPDVQCFFTSSIPNSLGGISSGIYLLHGPILHSLGLFSMMNVSKVTGRDTFGQKMLGFVAAALIVLPTTVILARYFRELVEKPCNRCIRWIENFLLASSSPVYTRP